MNEHKRQIETILSALLAARKCVQLYPTGNPTIEQSLEVLHQRLAEWFSEVGSFQMTVERDLFQIEGEFYSNDNVTVRRFAAEIYRIGVKALTIGAGISREELHTLVRLLGRTLESVEADGGLPAVYSALQLAHVAIETAEGYRLVQEMAPGTELDMLGYLVQREQRYQGEAELAAPPLRSLLADFFLELADGTHGTERNLLNTLESPDKIQALLGHIGQRGGAAEDGDAPDIAIRQMLEHIRNAMGGFSNETRAKYVQNLARALESFCSSNAEAPSLSELLAPGIGRNGIEDDVLGCLEEAAVREVLSTNLVVHDGTANTISNFLRDYVGDPDSSQRVKAALASQFSDSEDERLLGISKSLAVKDASCELNWDREQVDEQRNRLCQSLSIASDEIAELAAQAERETLEESEIRAAEVALQVFDESSSQVLPAAFLEVVASGIAAIWRKGDYARSCSMLCESAASAGRLVEGVKPLLAAPAYIDQLVDAMRAAEISRQGREAVLELFRQIGSDAVRTLFERLVTEKNRSLRLFIIGILSEFGEGIVPYLTTQMAGRPWFVLRNVALLLGKTRSDLAIHALEQIGTHSDKRVRLEVLEALAFIKGPRAEAVIGRSLTDPAPVVAEAAVSWLVQLDHVAAVPQFITMLAEKQEQLHHELPLSLSLLKALGTYGGQDALRAVEGFRPPWWLRLGKNGRRLDKACSQAIAQIGARLKSQQTASGADTAYV